MADLYDALTRELRAFGHRCDVPLARYDTDALLGHVMRWLAERDLVLTGGGLMSFEDWERCAGRSWESDTGDAAR